MRRFSTLFPQLVAAVSASLVQACSGGLIAEPEDASEAPACGADAVLPTAMPSGVSFVELRTDAYVLAPEGGTTRDVVTTVRASRGTRCEGAPDAAACEKKLAAAHVGPSARCHDVGCSQLYLVWQAGKDVGVVSTVADVVARFGPIDDEEKARLAGSFYAATIGATLRCSAESPKRIGANVFQLLTVQNESRIDGCGGPTTTTNTASVVQVDERGKLDVLASESESKVVAGSGVCPGRRPEGLREVPRFGGGSAGDYFAHAAHLEHASVTAFRVLERELAALGAPAPMLAKARRAARDEVRHTRAMSALARSYGAVVAPAVVEPCTPRDVLAIALENVREGCVGETYAALVAEWQSAHASSPRVRASFAVVARDEARHAELAWEVHGFLTSRLTTKERAEVESAREGALAELRRAVANEPGAELVRLAGLPTARVADRLLASLTHALEPLVA